MAAAAGQSLPADFDLSQMTIEDRAEYQIERSEIRLLP